MAARHSLITLALAALLAVFLAGPARARDIYAIEEYGSIQAALYYAEDGDTILIEPGIHYEPDLYAGPWDWEDRYRRLTIRSVTGNPDDTIIDCEGGRGIDLGFCDFRGITVTHAEDYAAWCPGNVTDCRFINNYGDGVITGPESSPVMTRCTFRNNGGWGFTPDYYGDQVDSCIFDANGLGGIAGGSPLIVNNSTFSNQPVGIYWGEAYVEGCTFRNNGIGIYLGYGSVELCSFQNNGIGIGQTDVDVDFCTFQKNGTGISDAPYVYVRNSSFTGNTGWAIDAGMGAYCVVTNSLFVGNGGGIRAQGDPRPYFHETVMALFCTITQNGGGGLVVIDADTDSDTFAQNSILWGNGAADIVGARSLNSDVGVGGTAGYGNISKEPRFIRNPTPGADGAWGTDDDDYGDLRLQPTSPCVDRGTIYDYGPWRPFPATDISHAPRVIGPQPDMGAYETPLGVQLLGLSRTTASAGVGPITLTAMGGIFQPGAVITWNGTSLVTEFLSTSKVRTTLGPDQLSIGGVFDVAVRNPDDSASNPLPFTVLNRIPAVYSLVPIAVDHGGPAFTLWISGDRFAPTSYVLVNGEPRPGIPYSYRRIGVLLSAAEIAQPCKIKIQVANPAPGGGVSTARYLTVR